MAKIALSAEFQAFSWKFRPLKNIFRTLENGHSIRHQSIPPLSAGRKKSGPVRPRQGTEICNFGAPSPLEALHWIFCSFSRFYVQFSKKSPRKSGESSEKSSGENRVKSCHVCGCHGFFGPEKGVEKGDVKRGEVVGE